MQWWPCVVSMCPIQWYCKRLRQVLMSDLGLAACVFAMSTLVPDRGQGCLLLV